MQNLHKSKNLKGWTLVSSIVLSMAGQAITVPSHYAVASVVTGVHNIKTLSIDETKLITFSDAKKFVEININLNDDLLKKVAKQSGISRMSKDKETKVWQAIDAKGDSIGYFFIDKVYGKHELITYSVGINIHGAVKHVEILDYRETYGWQIDSKEWRAQFNGKTITSELALEKDIKNISGATLSCKHIIDGVKRILALYEFSLRNKA